MGTWKYTRGEWTEIDDPLVWKEDEDWETVLKRAGYYSFPSASYGDDPYIAELYIKKDNEPPYLIAFSLSDYIEHVYIDDIPSLMQWLRDYTPIWSLQQIADLQEELLTLFGRAFRAWHGHDYTNVCPVCDPNQFKKQQETHQRLMEMRKTKQRSEAEREGEEN